MKASLGHLARSGMSGLFPPQCLCCGARVSEQGALCPDCWTGAPFIHGAVCDICGAPVGDDGSGEDSVCEECSQIARPWERGRAAVCYDGTARRLVLALKHADRLDLAPAMARWMVRVAAPVLHERQIIAPMPLSRRRLLKRRSNQAVELARAFVAHPAVDGHRPDYLPRLLQRLRHTPSQEGRGREERFENLRDAISVAPAYRDGLAGRRVLIIDDVMTSGASFAAAAEACLQAGAAGVDVLALARVAKDDQGPI